jgi:YfiH family protein
MTVSTLLDGFSHGFLGRRGGVSSGTLEGLNVGYGSNDDLESVEENRRRAVDAIAPGTMLVTVHQVHSPDAVHATAPWPRLERPHADAIVTATPGLLIGVVTADCAPVLFADPNAKVIGAAHAGWRGALGGVTDNTIAAMEALGARRADILAVVGPCIAQASYEVDHAFRDRFLAADPANSNFFADGPSGKPRFSLSGYVVDRLVRANIGGVAAIPRDTYADADAFYSFRRAAHNGEADYGRQLSAIALPPG